MELLTHSFIIRVWRETVDERTFIWRGHITHVPDGAQSYLKNLDRDVAAFIEPYLTEMGISARPRGWRQWWSRLGRFFRAPGGTLSR